MGISTPLRVLASALLLSMLRLCHAQVTRTVNVAGTGSASAAPDLATIDTGVETMAKTAMEALDANNKAFAEVLRVLKENGIEDRDVQTTFFNVNPRFARTENGSTGELIGYRVTNEVQVRVRDIDTLGVVLDALVRAGSNRISGVSFSLADPKPTQDLARRAAIEDAKQRAALYADAAGVKLGEIISISEQPITSPTVAKARTAEFSAQVPIATGELDISVTVFVLFGIVG